MLFHNYDGDKLCGVTDMSSVGVSCILMIGDSIDNRDAYASLLSMATAIGHGL